MSGRLTVTVLLFALTPCACRRATVAAASMSAVRSATESPGRERGAQWDRIALPGAVGSESPTAGEDVALAYDASRHRLWLYGGKGDNDKNGNELWSFDIATARWARVVVDGPQPPPREDHSLVVDTANDRLVLFGGEDGDTSNATWLFDPCALRWQEVTAEGAPALEGHVAIYDPKGRRMVVFGGVREHDGKRDLGEDTWLLCLDVASPHHGSWSRLDASTPHPAPRREHRGVYDPVRHRMLIAGGRQRSNASFLDDVWTLDLTGDVWSEVATHGERPNPFRQTGLGFDAEANELIVFGGEVLAFMSGHSHEAKEFPVNMIWVLDLSTGGWEDRTPCPPSMYDHAALFVPEYHATLVYGGSSCRSGLRAHGAKEHTTWLLHTR